jgi:guanylate kinase
MKKFRSHYIVLSAPSGAGKTTIAKMLANQYSQLEISISATTRPPRPQEKEGRDYFFISEATFQENIKKNNFLECEEVHGDYYGTLMNRVDDLVKRGKTVVFDIDVKGALSIKKKYPDAILIFIKTPSLEELKNRLKNRKSESKEAIRKRLSRIDYEYAQANKFDHIVINDNLNHAVKQIIELIQV